MGGEMKACPWCGKPPKVCPDTSHGAATVFCPDENDCPVQPVAGADLKAGETVADAVARWNDRSPADAGEVREKVIELIRYQLASFDYPVSQFEQDFADAIFSLLASPPVTDREEGRDDARSIRSFARTYYEAVERSAKVADEAAAAAKKEIARCRTEFTPGDFAACQMELAEEIATAIRALASGEG